MSRMRLVALALSLGLSAGAMAQESGRTPASLNNARSGAPRAADNPTSAGVQGSVGSQAGTMGAPNQAAPSNSNIASNNQAVQGSQAARLSGRDRMFFEDAVRGGTMEVAMARLAKEHAQSDEVKNFAQRMIDDHGKFNDELMQIGRNLTLVAPADMNRKHRNLLDKLTKLNGPAFDKQFMQAMVDDHKKDVAEFRKQSEKGEDGTLKTFAITKLPTLESHLSQAQQILDRMK